MAEANDIHCEKYCAEMFTFTFKTTSLGITGLFKLKLN